MKLRQRTEGISRWRKAILFSVLLCIGAIFFTACGKKVELPETDITEGDITDGDTSLSEGESIGIPERVEDDSYAVTIDADVIADGYGNLPVAIMRDNAFDEEDIKYYAETIFDEGSIEVVLPYSYCSKNFLLNEQARLEEQIKKLNYTEETIFDTTEYMYLGYQLEDVKKCINRYNEANDADVIENDGSYHWSKTEYRGYEEVMQTLTCQIKGTIEGKEYALQFVRIDYSAPYSAMCLFRITEMHYAEKMYLLEDEVYPLAPDAVKSIQENTCSLTEEDARGQVEAFADKLGIEGYVVNAVCQARGQMWHYDSDDILSNAEITRGYLVYLGRAVEGYTTAWIYPWLDTSAVFWGTDTGHEGIVAWVTDDGIERFWYVNPREISEMVSEDADVMSFGDIHKIALDYIKNETDEYVIDKIRFGIGMVRNGSDYSYIPTWCYEYNNKWSDARWGRSAYVISAVDGSVIDARRGFYIINKGSKKE